MKHFLALFSLLQLLLLNASAGTKLPLKLEWATEPVKIQTGTNEFKSILQLKNGDNASSFDYLPVFSKQFPLNEDAELSFSINNAVFEPLNKADDFELKQSMLTGNIEVKYQIHYFKKQPIATIYFIPLVKTAFGSIEKLISCELEVFVSPKAAKRSGSNPNYAQNSVLSNGNWYKFGVSKNSIYKLDYNFLTTLGLNPANIDPRNIRIYGNGGGMLPEENAAYRHDDLVENAIIVVGENDGRFDQGDYILFFAKGPDQWSYNNTDQRYQFEKNHYSDLYYYFITTDMGSGKRVSSAATINNPNITINSFDDFSAHESDEYNFITSGREWYGDLFNFSITSKDLTIHLRHLFALRWLPVLQHLQVHLLSVQTDKALLIKLSELFRQVIPTLMHAKNLQRLLFLLHPILI
jgi:hypothetical protein